MTTQTIQTLLAIDGELPPIPNILGTRPGFGEIHVVKSSAPCYLAKSYWAEVKLVWDEKELLPTDCIFQQCGSKKVFLIGFPTSEMYGIRWGTWISDVLVQQSAINHILRKKPASLSLVRSAVEPDATHHAFEKWMSVARAVLYPAQANWLEQVTRKERTWVSAIQVKAMPIRIASKLGKWFPPVAKPAYPNAEESTATQTAQLPIRFK